MGNTSTKLAEKCTLLSKDEVPVVAGSFKFVSKNSDRIKEDDLMKIWGSQMDARLAQYITNFLFGPAGGARLPHAGFQRFAELYVFCVRGTIDERIAVMLASFTPAATTPGGGQGTAGAGAGGGGGGAGGGSSAQSMAEENGACGYEISYPLVKEFVEAVVSSYVRAIRLEVRVYF